VPVDRFGSRVLTPKELSIIALLTEGMTNKEIAKDAGTTENMVKNYLRVIFDKTGMFSRLELALWNVTRDGSTGAKRA